jgi:hypothetical protein
VPKFVPAKTNTYTQIHITVHDNLFLYYYFNCIVYYNLNCILYYYA